MIDSCVDADGERLSEFREKIEEQPDREREAVHDLQVARVATAIEEKKLVPRRRREA